MNRLIILLPLFLFINVVYSQQITHGPMIGGITPTSAKIYIRTNIATIYSIQYTTDSTFNTNIQQTNNATQSSLDNTNICTISNLNPNTDYYFRYSINGIIQATTGHFKTFPTEGSAEHLVFVTGSCQETPNMKVFDAMPLHHPNMFIHTGDFTYPSYQIPRYYGMDYPQDWNAVVLAWQKRNEEPVCKEMLKKIPIAYMPDDDDTWGNSRYFKGGAAQIKRENGKLINYIDLYPRTDSMRHNCLKAYQQFFPGYPMVNDTDGYYHSFKAGNCEFFMIDVRSCNTGGWNNLKYNELFNWWSFNGNNPNNTLLNQPQLNWLLNGLKNSTATWKFIVSGVPFNKNIQTLVELPLLLQGTEFNISGQAGTGFRMSYSFSDYFGAYAYERTKILKYIQDNAIENVIVISGDTHGSAIDDGTNAGLPEMNASGLSVKDDEELWLIFNDVLSEIGFDLSKWLWNKGGMGIGNDNYKNAFGKIEVFGNDSVQLCVIDEDNIIVACHTILNNSPITTSIKQNNIIDNLFEVYPNPVDNILYLKTNINYITEKVNSIQLINEKGSIVKTIDKNSSTINMTDLSKGIYLLVVSTENLLSIQKVVKQ